MDQLFLKSFIMAETMIKADHLIRRNDGDGSAVGAAQRKGYPSPYLSELNQNHSRRFRRREQVSTYGEECGNKISRKFTLGVFDHYQVNDGKSDFAKALRSNEFIV